MTQRRNARAGSYAAEKEALLRRLRRIEGQVRGLQRMIQEDRYCPDVLAQIAAIRSALAQVGLVLVRSHARHYVVQALRQEDTEPVEDMVRALDRFLS